MADLNSAAISRPYTIPVTPDNPFYEIRALPGKGYGCIATTTIPRGTRILSDTPLLIVPVADYLAADISAVFSSLDSAQQALYFTLHSSHGQPLSDWPSQIHPSSTGKERQRIEEQHAARTGATASLISIFQTNCMEMGTGAAVFANAARFNHSCTPNACFTWNAGIGRETIHAMREVQQGEEITLCYVDIEHDKRLRAWELKHYGFVCKCEACGNEEDISSYAFESAQRRLQIQELGRETHLLRGARLAIGARQPGFVSKLLRMAGLLQEEGAWDARLAGVFLDLALVCEINGDHKMGVAAGKKALQIKRDCQGSDFPDYTRYVEAVARIQSKKA